MKSGKDYYYIVTAYSDTGVSPWYEEDQGQGGAYLSQALIQSIANEAKGISLSWNAVPGAQDYSIYRKAAGEDWQCVGATSSLKFTDELAHAGVTYTYGVQACWVAWGK